MGLNQIIVTIGFKSDCVSIVNMRMENSIDKIYNCSLIRHTCVEHIDYPIM